MSYTRLVLAGMFISAGSPAGVGLRETFCHSKSFFSTGFTGGIRSQFELGLQGIFGMGWIFREIGEGVLWRARRREAADAKPKIGFTMKPGLESPGKCAPNQCVIFVAKH